MGEVEMLTHLAKISEGEARKLLNRCGGDVVKAIQALAEYDDAWYEMANRRIWELVEDYAVRGR